jgi:hypothetical protein
MAVTGLLGLLLLVPPVLAVIVLVVALAVTTRPDATLAAELSAARRHSFVTGVLANATFALALLLCIPWALNDGADQLAAAPLLAAGTALLALLAGELTWPRQRGATRVAALNPRTLRSVASHGLLVGLAAASASLAVVVVAGGVRADAGGRTVTGSGGPTRTGQPATQTQGPFPGWDFGVWQLLALGAVVALVWLVVRAAALRAAVVRADVDSDNLLRRASFVRAARLATSGILFTLAADLVLAGLSLGDVQGDSAVTVGLTSLGVVISLAAFAVTWIPAPRLCPVPPVTGVVTT